MYKHTSNNINLSVSKQTNSIRIPIEIALLKKEFHRLDQEGKLIQVESKLSKRTRDELKVYAAKYDLTGEEAFFIASKIGLYELEGVL